MNRILPLFCVLALACACNYIENPEDSVPSTGLKKILIEATISDDDASYDTKTALGTGGTVLWSSEDKISLLNVSGMPSNAELTLSTGSGTTTASFTGEAVDCADGYYGVYPYDEDCEYASGVLTIPGWYGNNQTATAGSFANGTCIMVGRSAAGADPVSVNFKNLFALIKITLPSACSEVTVSGNNGETLACVGLSVRIDGYGNPFVTETVLDTRNYDRDAHLRLSGGGDFEAGTYYLAVIPQTLTKGFTIRIVDADGNILRRSTAKEVELKRSVTLNLGTMDYKDFITTGKIWGSGTESDPYLITTKEQLELLAGYVNNGADKCSYATAYYKQTCDIDCGSVELTPIGNPYTGKFFYGTYDGGGHSLKNFKIGRYEHETTMYLAGLFGAVCDATIHDLDIQPVSYDVNYPDIEHQPNPEFIAGTLAAYAKSSESGSTTITNCTVSGSAEINITSSGFTIEFGALVGGNYGQISITNCSNDVDFSVFVPFNGAYPDQVVAMGGMIGYDFGLTEHTINIDRCRNSGVIHAEGNHEVYAGGIVGRVYEYALSANAILRISNCVNSGEIVAYTSNAAYDTAAGGIVGSNRSDGSSSYIPILCNCLNKGEIVSCGNDGYGGGIIGFLYDETTRLYACVNMRNVYASISGYDCSLRDSYLGSIVGDAYSGDPGDYYWCYWTNNDGELPIFHGEEDYEHKYECGYKFWVSAYEDMNPILSKVPDPKSVGMAQWTGNSSDGSLDLDF